MLVTPLPDPIHLASLVCPKCKSTLLQITPHKFKNGTIHLKATCGACAKYIAYVRQYQAPQDPEDKQPEGTWCFPFGKYKGVAIAEVFRQEPGYVYWSAENLKHRIAKEECQNYLALVDCGKDFRVTD